MSTAAATSRYARSPCSLRYQSLLFYDPFPFPQADTLIMTIPRRYLITVEMGHESDIGSAMLAHSVDVTAKKHCYLCVYTMADRRNPDSYFQPYYSALRPHVTSPTPPCG